MTFSIVAWDPTSAAGPEWGVAVASKFLAVGAVVPWARAGVGAVATQAHANLAYGSDGLHLLASGEYASTAVEKLVSHDERHEHRQLGIVDGFGDSASFTGRKCHDWAGHITGDGFACQGNILTGRTVVESMAETFTTSTDPLADRMIAALVAGDAAGGDRRGRQSAAVLVVREGAGYDGGSDVAVDLRVDDHEDPVTELARLLGVHHLLFPRPDTLRFREIDPALATRMAVALDRHGYPPEPGTDGLTRALFDWMGVENLEERWSDDGQIEEKVLEILLDGG